MSHHIVRIHDGSMYGLLSYHKNKPFSRCIYTYHATWILWDNQKIHDISLKWSIHDLPSRLCMLFKQYVFCSIGDTSSIRVFLFQPAMLAYQSVGTKKTFHNGKVSCAQFFLFDESWRVGANDPHLVVTLISEHLVGKMSIISSFAHHDTHQPVKQKWLPTCRKHSQVVAFWPPFLCQQHWDGTVTHLDKSKFHRRKSI